MLWVVHQRVLHVLLRCGQLPHEEHESMTRPHRHSTPAERLSIWYASLSARARAHSQTCLSRGEGGARPLAACELGLDAPAVPLNRLMPLAAVRNLGEHKVG